MKTKTNKRKNILSVLLVMVMLVATLLTACSSGETAAAPANEETTKAEVTEEATAVEQAKEVATPEPTEELTSEPEPTPEPVEFEGIDMESTLPGLEWIATFDNIDVDEPLIVVYNDETNKKVIVQEGDEVEFSKSSDILALYTPNQKTITIISIPGGFDKSWEGDNELLDSETSPRRIVCQKGINTSDITQKCTFLAMLNEEMKEYEFMLKFVE